MSIFRPAGKIFLQFSKIQQLSPISTTSHLFADCSKRPKGKPKCDPVKSVGCAPKARKDCTPKQKERMICQRLEVPDPSYAECLKDPRPKSRMSECTTPKLPPLHCIKPNPGISIDGCQPPAAPKHGTCKPRISKAKSKKKKCDPKDICDPDLKPYKSAGPINNSEVSCPSESAGTDISSPSTSSGVSCPSESAGSAISSPSTGTGMSCSSSPMTSKMCEPEPPSSPFSTPFRNYSTKCKSKQKPKKPCFEAKKIKKVKAGSALSSPVSCTVKGVKGNKCEQAKCGPSYEPCDQPRLINQHKCPVRVKKPRMMPSKTINKKRKIKMGYKICHEPKRGMQFSCKPKAEKRRVAVKPPPTPTRCPCFKPVDLDAPSNVPVCKKMPGAVEPNCKKKGGKPKAVCEKDVCANK